MRNKFNLTNFVQKNNKLLVTTAIISLSLANTTIARAEDGQSDVNEVATEEVATPLDEGRNAGLLDSLYELLEPQEIEVLSTLLLQENEVRDYLEEGIDNQFVQENSEQAIEIYNYVLSNFELSQQEIDVIENLKSLMVSGSERNDTEVQTAEPVEEPTEELNTFQTFSAMTIEVEEIRTADELYNEAMYATFATDAWNAALEFIETYPNDQRLNRAINKAANRQMILGENNHRNGKFNIAVSYYQRILSVETVDTSIKSQAQNLLNKAANNKGLKTADELYNDSLSADFASDAWDIAVEFKNQYPNDSRVASTLNKAADRLMILGTSNHQNGNFSLALSYYNRVLSEEIIDSSVLNKAEMYAQLASSNKSLLSANELYNEAMYATFASDAWEAAMILKAMYPADSRLEKAINKAADRQLILGRNNHLKREFDLASAYYSRVLSQELVNGETRSSATTYHALAENKLGLQSADELYNDAMSASYASEAWEIAQLLKWQYPEDNRVSKAINNAANRLAILGRSSHRSGNFARALDYYNRILSDNAVNKALVEEISTYQKQAQNNDQLVTADQLYNDARYATFASDAWEAAQLLKRYFPSDSRIVSALNNAGNRLMVLGRNNHSNGNFDIAIDYYTNLLSENKLSTNLLTQASVFLEYAQKGEDFKTADELYNEARYASFASDAWDAAINLKMQYPGDDRIQSAIAHAADRIFTLGLNNHRKGNFNLANSYYERLVDESFTPNDIHLVAKDFLALSQSKSKPRSASDYRRFSENAAYASDAWNYALNGLALAPNNSNLLLALDNAANRNIVLGRNNQKSGNDKLAVSYFNRVINEPRVSQSLITLATVFKNQIVTNDKPTVVIDPGHGGYESGATFFGVREKLLNLNTSQYLKNELEAMGYHVVMTRNADTFIDLYPRAVQANEELADIFVSVHYNALDGSGRARGIETFIHHTVQNAQKFGQETNRNNFKTENVRIQESLNLADNIHEELISATGFYDRGVKGNNFSVLRNTQVPAVLLELGFMDNRSEFNIITQRSYQKKAAQAVAKGIDKYFKEFM